MIRDEYTDLDFGSISCPGTLSGETGSSITCTASARNGTTTAVVIDREDRRDKISIAKNELVSTSLLEDQIVQRLRETTGATVTADCGATERLPVDEGTKISCTVTQADGSTHTVRGTAHPNADDAIVNFDNLAAPAAATPALPTAPTYPAYPTYPTYRPIPTAPTLNPTPPTYAPIPTPTGLGGTREVATENSSTDVENFVKAHFSELHLDWVNCPEGLGREGGTRVECSARFTDGSYTTVKITRAETGKSRVTATVDRN